MVTSAVRPLEGRHIVITRPAGQAAHLAEALADLGAKPVLFPVLAIFDVEDLRPLQEAAIRLDGFDWACFVSPNAVEKSLSVVLSKRAWPKHLRAATVGKSSGHSVVVLTTGGRTEQFAMRECAGLPQACFVQMGDFLRYALDTAVQEGLREVVIGGMVGKLTKIAQGETITHANRAEVDTGLLAELAASIGAPADECAAIAANVTARFAAERMQVLGLLNEFHDALARKVISTLCAPERYGNRFRLRVLVCDFDGQKIAEACSTDAHV